MIAPHLTVLPMRSVRDGAVPVAIDWRCVVRDWFQRQIFVPAFRALFAPFEVSGTEHVESVAGPLILAANHASHLDAMAIIAALPDDRRRSLMVAAAEDYFYCSRGRRLLLTSMLAAYPFRRTGDTRCSLARTGELLAAGRSVLLFPEGTRSPDGSIGKFRRGVALITAAAGVPVIPTYIEGVADAMPKGAGLPRRRPVAVGFGAPLLIDQDSSKAAFADALRERVIELKEARRRG